MYDCGTPFKDCNGAQIAQHGIRATPGYKVHGTAEDARRCQKRYLARENAERRESGRPILLGSKPQRLKRGKNVEGKGGRWLGAPIR